MRPNNFDRRRTGAIVLCLAATTIFAISCGGNANKKSADGVTETAQTETKAPAKGAKIPDIPKDKINALSWESSAEKEAVIAEIPKELLKAIGKLTYCNIQSSGTLPGYKYTLAIRTSNEDPEADALKLVEYYKSIGGTVEESKALLNDYDVRFDYAESVTVYVSSSAIQVQFSVVKQ